MSNAVSEDDIEFFRGAFEIFSLSDDFTQVEDSAITVCPNGHVHLFVDDREIVLSPDDADKWVGQLYDAARVAELEGDDE